MGRTAQKLVAMTTGESCFAQGELIQGEYKANTRRIQDSCNDYGEGGKDKTSGAMSMGKGREGSFFGAGRTKVSCNDYVDSCLAQVEYKTAAMTMGREAKTRQLQCLCGGR